MSVAKFVAPLIKYNCKGTVPKKDTVTIRWIFCIKTRFTHVLFYLKDYIFFFNFSHRTFLLYRVRHFSNVLSVENLIPGICNMVAFSTLIGGDSLLSLVSMTSLSYTSLVGLVFLTSSS